MKKRLFSRARSLLRVKKNNHQIVKAMGKGLINLPFGPSSLNLMMVDSCNAQCIMCGKDYQSCGSMEYLSLEEMKILCDHLDMSQVVDIIYGGGGEPFLNPELASIAEYINGKYPAIQHTVISNFIQWKEKAVSSMLEHYVHFLVSVNAASRETYKEITGVDAYDAVVRHLENLIRLRRDKDVSVHVALSMILMRQNIEELGDFIALAADLGADEVKTLYVRVYPEEYRDKKGRATSIASTDSLFYCQDRCDELVLEAERIAEKKNIRFDHEPLFSCSKRSERNCCEPWKSLFVNFNGDVYPCPASEILFKPKVDSGEYNSGNIFKQSIEDIWNNPFWQSLRATNRPQDRKDYFPECRCCGNSLNWWGCKEEKAHVLDWSTVGSGNEAGK